ncbi:MAG TPA: ISL3 family transposase [Jiangellales bacterium]|nr:ISL3 family transposase [Jiangellales bacterium]
MPYGATVLRLVWHKRRWRCVHAGCARSSFTETVPAVPAGARLTTRLRAELGTAVAEQGRCVAEVAGHYRVSWATVHAAFADRVDPVLARPLPLVAVLGIDETRRGRPRWARDPATGRWVLVCDRWHTGFVDAAGHGGLLGQVEGRSAAAVTAWLSAQPQHWRDAITHVAIDLSASYAKAVREALPDAVLVADRFHLIRLANDALTAVRQRVIREDQGRRGRKIDPAWRARRRLLTAHERLHPASFARMWNSLVDTGAPGWEILGAYVAKEDLRALLALAGTDPDRTVIRSRLEAFYQRAAASPAPEVHRLAGTVEAWWPAVEAGIRTGHSNARSEGYNRLAKHQGRNAFGFRNPVNQTPPHTLGLHPPTPASDSHDHNARSNAMSRKNCGTVVTRSVPAARIDNGTISGSWLGDRHDVNVESEAVADPRPDLSSHYLGIDPGPGDKFTSQDVAVVDPVDDEPVVLDAFDGRHDGAHLTRMEKHPPNLDRITHPTKPAADPGGRLGTCRFVQRPRRQVACAEPDNWRVRLQDRHDHFSLTPVVHRLSGRQIADLHQGIRRDVETIQRLRLVAEIAGLCGAIALKHDGHPLGEPFSQARRQRLGGDESSGKRPCTRFEACRLSAFEQCLEVAGQPDVGGHAEVGAGLCLQLEIADATGEDTTAHGPYCLFEHCSGGRQVVAERVQHDVTLGEAGGA